MEPRIKYTSADVAILKDILDKDAHSILTQLPEAYLEKTKNTAGVEDPWGKKITWKDNPNEYLIKYVVSTFDNPYEYENRLKETCFIFAFMFFVPLSEVPLYLNEGHPIIKKLVKWRLTIGK